MTEGTIKSIIKEAVFLSNRCNEYATAVEYFQKALILLNDLRIEKPFLSKVSPIPSSTDIDVIQQQRKFTSVRSKANKKSNSHRDDHDEGLYLYTKTFAIPDNADVGTSEISIFSVEAVLHFNLGICYLLLGGEENEHEATLYFDKAMNLLESCANRESRILTFDSDDANSNLDSIAVLHNEGLLHVRSERFDDALDCYYEAMRQSILLYGDQDLSVASALNSIGVVLLKKYSQDNKDLCEKSLESLEKSLSIRLRVLGKSASSDECVATTYNNIGRAKFLKGDIECALSFHEDSYNIRRLVLGDEHPDTGVAAFNTGNCLQSLGRHDIAVSYYALFVKPIFYSENLELLTEKVVLALEYIAEQFHEDSSFDYAGTFYQLTLKSARKVFSDNHEYLGYILNKCGNFYFEGDELEDALQSYEEGLERENKIYPSSHVNVATTLSNIARVYEYKDCHEEALHFYERSLDSFSSNTVMENMAIQGIITVNWKIGEVQEKLGNSSLALDAFRDTLSFQKRHLGSENFNISCTLNRIGIILMGDRRYKEALSTFEECLRIRKLVECPVHSTSTALFNIACAQLKTGNTDESLLSYTKVLDLEVSKKDDPDQEFDALSALETIDRLANISLAHKGKPEKALLYYKDAMQICIEEGPDAVPLTILSRYLGKIGSLHLQLGDKQSAITFLSETVRINRLIGLDDYHNVDTAGYELYIFSKKYLPSASAA